MPSLQDIERFKEYLNALGDEPAILAERGQSIQDIQQPQPGLGEDLSDLFGDTIAPGNEDEGLDTLPADFLDLGEEPAAEQGPSVPPDETEDVFGIPDVSEGEAIEEDEFAISKFGDETPEKAGEEFLGPLETDEAFFEMPEAAEEPESFEIPETGEETFDIPGAGEEEFAVPEFGEEFPGPEEADEESFEIPGGIEEDFETGEAEEESFGISEMDGDFFGMPGEEEEVSGITEDEGEPFELPDMEEESFGMPGEDKEAPGITEDEGEPFELPDMEEESFGMPGEEEEAPGITEDEGESFELPDMEEESFGISEMGEEAFEMPEAGEAAGGAEAFEIDETGDETGEAEEFTLPSFEDESPAAGASGSSVPDEETLPVDFLDDEAFGNLETVDDEGFNLDFEELGDQFGIYSEESVEETPVEAVPTAESAGVEELHEGDEGFEIKDGDFESLKAHLNLLPRNLKLAIEELIGEKGLSGDRLKSLIDLLITGASIKQIAGHVSRITGKKIEIPVQYEKKTGEEFEAEKGTFAYAFKQNILPMLRIFVPAVLAAILLTFIGIRFVYRPIKAWSLYRTGYEEIAEERFDSANSYFDRAFSIWRTTKWFYEYAEGFKEQRKYRYAEEKYLSLLREYPDERQGVLDLADLQGMVLGKYSESIAQLATLLDKDRYDREALLLNGDIHMQWALTVPEHYEDARKAYAALIHRYGERDEYLFRMLRYFLRTDNYKEVMRLKYLFEANERTSIDPVVYAEMGGYLIDKNELGDVRKILFRAMDIDETVPEIHYNLARLFHHNEEFTEEDKALTKAIGYLESETARNPYREGMLIDSYARKGERLYSRSEFLDAESYFVKAREHYETALRMRTLSPDPVYGRIYDRLGNIYYYQDGDIDTADALFQLAETNAYKTPDLDFKRGYILFRHENYKAALLRFYDSGEGFSNNRNLLYATANSLYERGDFFAAEGYYDHLLDILENERKNTLHFLIDERPDHRALVENLMKTYNNQGVVLYNLSMKTGDRSKVGDALYYFTESLELYDYLSRDPETLEAADTVNLAFLNSRAILYPVGNYRLQIYRDIPRDMEELFF